MLRTLRTPLPASPPSTFTVRAEDGSVRAQGMPHAEDAAVLLSVLGDGATISAGAHVLYRQGTDPDASGSYDAVAELVNHRRSLHVPTYRAPAPDGVPFCVDDSGNVEGRPYVLPHRPGTPPEGLAAGWYYVNRGGAEHVGPFQCAYWARVHGADRYGPVDTTPPPAYPCPNW